MLVLWQNPWYMQKHLMHRGKDGSQDAIASAWVIVLPVFNAILVVVTRNKNVSSIIVSLLIREAQILWITPLYNISNDSSRTLFTTAQL